MAEMTTKTASTAKATTTVIVNDAGRKDGLAGGAIGGIVAGVLVTIIEVMII